MTWQLWQAVVVQACVTAGLGVLAFLVLASRQQLGMKNREIDGPLVFFGAAFLVIAGITGAVAAYVAIGTPT